MSDEKPPPAAVASPNPLMVAAGRAKDSVASIFKERKPWGELADRTSFSRPANFAEAMSRLRKNAAYFRVNYLLFVGVVTAVCFCLHPASLFVVAFLAMAWLYLFIVRQAPIVIGGRTFSEREKFIGISIVSLIVTFFLTSVGTILFLALGISVAGIALHGSLRVPDDLFTDEAETQQGLFGFLTAPTSSVANGANLV
ncbi:hypothetical protein WJX73_008683 [Symbiochloris irregularis]|uniref:PRA1 family protein n=1 Tax=Symbiochloris irregularis TaxID=706552 RepID=A0AAW1PHS4_9CHLO